MLRNFSLCQKIGKIGRFYFVLCILYFFEVIPDDRHKKVGKSDCFGIFRKFFIVSKNGGNGSSGRTRGPLKV